MVEKISTLLQNKINDINNNNKKRESLIAKIVAYNNGDINIYLDNGGNNKRVLLNRWYHQSYPVFIRNAKCFIESDNSNQKKELLTNLITNTMSWIAGIPKSSIHNNELVERVHAISRIVSRQSYKTCNISITNNDNPEEIFLCCEDDTEININEYVRLINTLINSNDKFYNFPTVTKLMHFINPNVFPIFDTNVKNVLFGESKALPTGAQFICYIQALRNLLKDPIYGLSLRSLTDEVNASLCTAGHYNNLSTLRVIDLILFDESMD